MNGIRNCTNQGPGLPQRGDNHQKKETKIGFVILKIFFSRTTKPEKFRFTQKPP
jgi:hypothetical protein